MNNIHLNDFNNICRTCLNNCDVKFFKDNIITNIFHKLTEIHFETNDELPQQICRKCYEKVNVIHEFSLQCKRSNSELLECLHKFKNPGIHLIKQELLEETNPLKTEEITIEEHNIEFSKDEILNPGNELKIEKDHNVSEEKIIPETKDQNIDCFESIFLKQETPDITEPNEEETINNSDDSNIEPAEKTNDYLKETKEKHKCNICNKSFIYLKSLEQHKISRICDRSYKCEQCSKTFKRSSHLKQHMGTHSSEHRTKSQIYSKKYKCEQCSKQFAFISELTVHMRTHTGERPYKCDQCSQTFYNSSDLKKHMRKHTGERPYKCELCSKAFTQSFNLKTHIRTHTDERPYKCNQCSNSFTHSTSLRDHMRMHTGERPFKCDQCSNSFSRSTNLKEHMRTHTGERPYKCVHCVRTFTQSSNLKDHMRRIHT